MSERDALIQTILDNPDDDTARLVYADWQQEYGDAAHADLIRTQCALARLPADDPGAEPLRRRETELLARPENAALVDLGNTFVRGFVDQARECGGPDGSELDDVPLDRVRFLDASYGGNSWPNAESAVRIAAHPAARRIFRLSFFEWTLDGAVLRALATSPHLVNLREVEFNHSDTDHKSLVDLLLAPSVRGVERVELYGDTDWRLAPDLLARVFADPRAERLRVLRVSAEFTDVSLAAVLLGATGLDQLRVILRDGAEWLTPPVRAALRERFGDRVEFVEY